MSVLFLMPTWYAPSELWMQRMIDELLPHLSNVVSLDTHGNKYWRNKVKATSLIGNNIIKKVSWKIDYPDAFGFPFWDPRYQLIKETLSDSTQKIICHYGDFATKLMGVWRIIENPLFVHFHGYDATIDFKDYANPGKHFFTDKYINDLNSLSERALFIANSNYTRKLLTNFGIDSSRIVVKYLGVPKQKKNKIHQKTSKINILQLGRLVDFKGPDLTIKAFEIACSKGFDGNLYLAGDGPLKPLCYELKLKSKYSSRIHLLGAINHSKVEEIYLSSDIYTQHNIKGPFSNQEECLGVAILEAMSYGLPIVCTNSGGVKETVLNGENGILLEPGDIHGQAEHFIELGQNPYLRQQIGEKGKERIEKYFNSDLERLKLFEIMDLS